ncbi:hypothetical protein KSP39_PZI007135 [Platanthera zijinensis]|uniref:Uncharacterized protein n=1 Tax=Platanthera zijinensis TaxID=2320716 RepID=A0AAP0G9E9_9ASPA
MNRGQNDKGRRTRNVNREASFEIKYGGIMPRKKPLISKVRSLVMPYFVFLINWKELLLQGNSNVEGPLREERGTVRYCAKLARGDKPLAC